MRQCRVNKGFTLIEMAVTMGVFAILVAVSVPAMRTWISNSKVRAVSDGLQTALREAQAESLRRSRQVVFAMTDSATPANIPLPAVANGTTWAIYTLPSMTDGTETPTIIDSGDLSANSTSVTVNGVAAVCFNSLGRLVANSTNVLLVTGGPVCSPPSGGAATLTYAVSLTGADRPLQVNLTIAGQVHMCDPNVALSTSHPEGC